MTRVSSPLEATATNFPLPYATDDHALAATPDDAKVQELPSGVEYIARVSSPLEATATNFPPP